MLELVGSGVVDVREAGACVDCGEGVEDDVSRVVGTMYDGVRVGFVVKDVGMIFGSIVEEGMMFVALDGTAEATGKPNKTEVDEVPGATCSVVA